MERRVRWKLHARCGAGEKMAITSKPYLLLSSQVLTPSTEDLEVTQRLQEAGALLGVEVLDHLIVSQTEYVSFKEQGYM